MEGISHLPRAIREDSNGALWFQSPLLVILLCLFCMAAAGRLSLVLHGTRSPSSLPPPYPQPESSVVTLRSSSPVLQTHIEHLLYASRCASAGNMDLSLAPRELSVWWVRSAR